MAAPSAGWRSRRISPQVTHLSRGVGEAAGYRRLPPLSNALPWLCERVVARGRGDEPTHRPSVLPDDVRSRDDPFGSHELHRRSGEGPQAEREPGNAEHVRLNGEREHGRKGSGEPGGDRDQSALSDKRDEEGTVPRDEEREPDHADLDRELGVGRLAGEQRGVRFERRRCRRCRARSPAGAPRLARSRRAAARRWLESEGSPRFSASPTASESGLAPESQPQVCGREPPLGHNRGEIGDERHRDADQHGRHDGGPPATPDERQHDEAAPASAKQRASSGSASARAPRKATAPPRRSRTSGTPATNRSATAST